MVQGFLSKSNSGSGGGGGGLNLDDVNGLLQVLLERKRSLEQHAAETNLELLLLFLQASRWGLPPTLPPWYSPMTPDSISVLSGRSAQQAAVAIKRRRVQLPTSIAEEVRGVNRPGTPALSAVSRVHVPPTGASSQDLAPTRWGI